MAEPLKITEGWSKPLPIQLKINGSGFNAAGMTVVPILRDRDGQQVSVVGAWSDQVTALVQLEPTATTFRASRGPYTLKWRVVDGASQQVFFPQGDADQILVKPA